MLLIRKLPNLIKRLYKQRRYSKLAVLGPNVQIHAVANIKKDSDSEIIIHGNNDILCNLIALDGARIEIGKYSTIRANSVVGATKSIIIGDYVIISNNVHIYDNNNHPTSPDIRKSMCESGFYSSMWDWSESISASVIIENNVWIGERSTILKGVHIGTGSIVACDSVVTKDVPSFCIVAGNPAKIVKRLEPIKDNK